MRRVLPLTAFALGCGGQSVQPETPPASPATAEALDASAPSETLDSATTLAVSSSGATPSAASNTLSGTVTSLPAGAMKNAVVYLEDAPASVPVKGRVDNKQMAFVPYVEVITVGSAVTFFNSDPFPHNVFSPDNEKFDIGQITQNGSKDRKFDREGTYTLLCNLHPNMKGYVVVVPSSAFAKADRTGAYQIKGLAGGTYKVTAWAPGTKPDTKSVALTGDQVQDFNLRR